MMMGDKEYLFDGILRIIRERKALKCIPKNSVCCDICCSRGKFLKRIEATIKEGIGIDARVKNHKSGKITLINYKINSLFPLKSKTYDVVTLLASIEHFDNPEKILRESNRILKKSGRIILTTPLMKSNNILRFMAKIGIIDKALIDEHKELFNPKKMKLILEKIGFKDIKIKTFEFGLNMIIIARK